MVDRPFKAAIEADERQMSQEIADAITKALGTSKVLKQANTLNGDAKAKDWPKKPNGKVILFYQKTAQAAWSKMKSNYRGIKVDIEVRGYPKGKPFACAWAKYTGKVLGGSSRTIAKGDTITSISKEAYGYDIYAETVWDHNEKLLGRQCKQLPVGFAIELPKIFVPDWLKPPSAKIAAGAKSSAVEVPAPPLEWAFPKTAVSKKNVVLGPVIVTISCIVEGSVVGVKTTPVSPSFTFANYEAQFKKAIGPYKTSFNLAMNASESSIDLGLFNQKVKGLEFTGNVKIVSGGAQISLGTATTSKKIGDLSIKGQFTASAKLTMKPNPDWVSQEERMASYGAAITIGGLLLLAGGSAVIAVGRAAAAAELPGGAAGLKEVIRGMREGARMLQPCLAP